MRRPPARPRSAPCSSNWRAAGSGPLDGRYGPRTQAAVARFQSAYGLTIDGVAGPATLGGLTARIPVLYPGAGAAIGGGAVVRILQRHLARAGYSPGHVDGIFGPRTETAVRRFQTANRLPADGIAGARTMARLQPPSTSGTPAAPHPSRRRPGATPPAHRTPPPHGIPVPRRSSHPAGVGRPQTRHVSGAPGWELPAGFAVAAGLLLLGGAWYVRRRRGEPPQESPSTGRPASPAEAPAASAAAASRHAAAPDIGTPDTATPVAASPSADPAAPLELEREFERADQRFDAHRAFIEGVRLDQQQDRAAAKAAYRRADTAGHGGAACNLGILMEVEGDVPGARAAYGRADQRGDANGSFNLGCLLEDQGDRDGAQTAYERADERGHPEAATNLGVLLESRGLIADARAAYERAERRGDPNGAANLGALLEELGERGASRAAFRRAKQMRERAMAHPAAPSGNAKTASRPAPSYSEKPDGS